MSSSPFSFSKTTEELFGTFPRDMRGKYGRVVVENQKKMFERMQQGMNHISVYDLNFLIDKVVIDIDSNSVEKSFQSTIEVIERIENEGADYVPVFSGRRGFHIYILTEKFQPPNKPTGNVVIRKAQEYFSEGVDHIDTQFLGDVRHMLRLPNTCREDTNCLCTYLPKEFVDWTPEDVVVWSKEMHSVDYSLERNIDVRKYITKEAEDIKSFRINPPDLDQHPIPENIKGFLERLIRPSIFKRAVEGSSPGHMVRTEFVAELSALGYDAEHILAIISRLGWSNYDERTTWYHIDKIVNRGGINPMATKKLKTYVSGVDESFGYPWRSTEEVDEDG